MLQHLFRVGQALIRTNAFSAKEIEGGREGCRFSSMLRYVRVGNIGLDRA